MTKFALIISLLIIPMLAMISEAVTPNGATTHYQKEDHAVRLSQTTSNGKGLISTSGNQGAAPLSVHFYTKMSNSQENDTVYSWNFGDGNVSQGKSATHAFAIPGEYTTTLTITDQQDLLTEYATIITVTDGLVSL